MTAARSLKNAPEIERARDAAPPSMRAEIIGGMLLMSPAPRFRHQRAFGLLFSQLEAKLGFGWDRRDPSPAWCLVQVPEIHLGPGPDMLNPDIAGWRIDRAPGPDEYPFRTAPDWVCEVLSPTTERYDRATKLPVFASYGTTHAWLVDPDERVLEVFRLSDAKGPVQIARFEGDVRVRAEPFESVEIELAALWR
jgi:Uma2 family endonuclease